MQFSASTKPLSEINSDLLILGLFEGQPKPEAQIKELDKALDNLLTKITGTQDFKGKPGETVLIWTNNKIGASRILLLGLGKPADYKLEGLRSAISATGPVLQKYKIKSLAFAVLSRPPRGSTVDDAAQAVAESLVLSNYKFTIYKNLEVGETRASLTEAQFVLNKSRDKARVLKAAGLGLKIAQTVNWARDLGNHPSNVATPSHLASHAEKIAKADKKIKVSILHKKDIEREKMGALLAVAQGSDEEPKFIILEYLPRRQAGRPKKTAPTVVLVGKGITFDSGGISIKPSDKMEEMKFDMSGGATVMATVKLASELNLPINIVGLVPTTENLPSGKAIKPGDIVRSRSGKTIEIVNTDAEGRLILSDALDYAKQYKPELVIDFATLTGAIVVALGDDLIGAFANSEKYLSKLKTAAQTSGEKIWPMPLEKDYEPFIKSDFADLRNIGTVRNGDAINAAIFLQKFVDYPWIHLDIAGVAWATREKPYRPKGATGVGIRLAIEFLKRFRK